MKSVIVIVLCGIGAMELHAGMPDANCTYPFVFRDARVNVIVLPYKNQAIPNPSLDRTATQLTLLLQQTLLFSSLKYPAVGTVRMAPLDPKRIDDCKAAEVEQKILGKAPGAQQQLSPDGAAILLWGQLYQEGDKVYLCSYAKLVKRGGESVMESSGGGHGVFTARLPSNAVTFPTREIATELLEQIGSDFRKSALVHRDRSFTSPGYELPMDPARPFPYQVVEATTDGWMHIRGMDGGTPGWIYASSGLRRQALAESLPELRYVDGAIGFLEFAKGENPSGLAARARPSLESFPRRRKGTWIRIWPRQRRNPCWR